MIFVFGVHGVGKSYFSNLVKKYTGIETYSASTLIAAKKQSEFSKDKLILDIDDNQQFLLKRKHWPYAEVEVKEYFGKKYLYLYLIVIVSMMLNGLGVALMRISCMGTDPFSSMNYSFSEFFHIPLGTVVILVSCILLGLSFFAMKSSLGFGTVANIALLGTSADMWTSLITRAAGHEISLLEIKGCFRMCPRQQRLWDLASRNTSHGML